MAEELTIYEVGDRFATITRAGKVVIWQVDLNGTLFEAPVPIGTALPERDVERPYGGAPGSRMDPGNPGGTGTRA